MRDIVVHQAGNAEELARVLGAHLAGQPVATRGFEEREGPLRSLNDADLWDALLDRMATLDDVAAAAEAVPADTDVAWTGRTMKVPCFAEHMREGLVLHGWDITGDEAAAQARLAEPWMTSHSVLAVGRPLLVKGATQLGPGERIEARLRADGVDDVVLAADPDRITIDLAAPEGPATLETDAAASRAAAVGAQARRSVTHSQPRRTADSGTRAPPTRRLLSRFVRSVRLRSCYR
ncbi:hypothetical protein MMAN_27760 [Mycobacterium mantenii]|uniref:Uncharacterized protein n=1 Tax=Mycobacterium mantenii TaxID=560555 RepID=A0ABM7JSV9_MYCNT|nr:hypothetical protein MMAN_27760 [Mycobacterium mantenii]